MPRNGGLRLGKVTVVGTSSSDQVLYIGEFPSEDHKYMCALDERRCGGIPLNVGVNLALLGVSVSLVSWVGRDGSGRFIRKHAKRMGISIDGLAVGANSTPQVFILASKATGTRTAFMTEHDRPSSLTRTQKRQIIDSTIVHYDGSLPEIAPQIFKLCKQKDVLMFVNYDLPSFHAFEAFLSSDFGVASEQALCKGEKWDWEQLERELMNTWQPNHKYIGVTLGKRGSLFFDGDRVFRIPAIAVTELDTTGAGDAFQAGLVFGLLRGWNLAFSMRFASSLGALKCVYTGSNLSDADGLNVEKEALDLVYKTKWDSE